MISVLDEKSYFPRLIDLPVEIGQKYNTAEFFDASQRQKDKKNKPPVVVVFSILEYLGQVPPEVLKGFEGSLIILVSPWSLPSISQTSQLKKIQIPASIAQWGGLVPEADIDVDNRVFARRFMSLNFRSRWPRQALAQFLVHHDIIDDCYFSYHGWPDHPNTFRQQYDINNHAIGKTWFNEGLDLDWFFDQLPLKTNLTDSFKAGDIDGESHNRQANDPGSIEYWQNSFAAVVCETFFFGDNDPVFTEKTLKPLAYGLPFLLCSSDSALASLREMGFQTFGDVFDESYDSVKSPQQRVEHIMREIKRLHALPSREIDMIYKKLIPRLKSNQRVLREDLFDLYEKQRQEAREQIQTWILER